MVCSVPGLGEPQIAEQTDKPPSGDMNSFLTGIIGEWVGTCRHSTNGEKAEDKYFHAVIRQVAPGGCETVFDYYRIENGEPLKVGTCSITTTIGPDGLATSKIRGEGVVLIENKPKNQRHELTEVLRLTSPGKLEGVGTGVISVSGMPLGLGKGGKIKETRSLWTVSDGALTIQQSIKVAFRMLFVNKTFTVTADYKASRGSDVAALVAKSVHTASKPSGNAQQPM